MNKDIKKQILDTTRRTFSKDKFWHSKDKGPLAVHEILTALDKNGLKMIITSKNDTCWDTFVREIGYKLHLSSEIINDFLDGLGSYYDIDQEDHWPEMLFKIERWITYNIGKRDGKEASS
jgi:hypothetical protein